MRVFGLAGLLLALVAGPASAAGLELPPKVQVSPLPPGAKPLTLNLTRAVIQIPDGKDWATESDWLTCGLFPRRARWNAEASELEVARLKSVFEQELAGLGFNRQSVNLFDDQPTSTNLQVGALIKDMQAQFCANYDANPTTYGGKMRMTVEWQIYDVLKREVIARIGTTAGGEERRRSVDGPERVMLAAFRENVRALAADDTFRRLTTPSSTPVATPALSPIALSTVTADKRPIGSAADAVVAVFTGAGHGSGFLISPDGYLITNQHVVGDATQVRVRWSDKTESVGDVLRVDRRRDVALVKVDAGARKPLALRRTATDLGQVVFAIGTPLDPKLQGTVTRGIVSANRVFEGQAFIQSDVIINGGNSGGPLLDETGNVIGVAVSGYEISGAPVGINLFIPIDDALKVLALQPAS